MSHLFRFVLNGIFNIWIGIFCDLFFDTFKLYVPFIVVCSYSKVLWYVIFILFCTASEVRICVHYICIILILRQEYSASLQHQENWCQLPLCIPRLPSRANCGATVPAGANVRSSHPRPTNVPSSPSLPSVPSRQ